MCGKSNDAEGHHHETPEMHEMNTLLERRPHESGSKFSVSFSRL